MKNIKEIGDAIMTIVIIKKEGDEGVQKLLKEWAESIIDEIAEHEETYMNRGSEWGIYANQEAIERLKKQLWTKKNI